MPPSDREHSGGCSRRQRRISFARPLPGPRVRSSRRNASSSGRSVPGSISRTIPCIAGPAQGIYPSPASKNGFSWVSFGSAVTAPAASVRCAAIVVRLDAVEPAELRYGRAVTRVRWRPACRPNVILWYFTEASAFRQPPSCSLLFVGFGLLVFEVLPGVRMDVRRTIFLSRKVSRRSVAVLEVDQPLGVERLPVVAGLEMEMRAGAASRRAAQTDDLSRLDPFVRVRTMRSERCP